MTVQTKDDRRRVLFLAQLPPPVHGLSMMSRRVHDHMSSVGWEVETKSQVSARSLKDMGTKSPAKFIELFRLILWLVRARVSKRRFDVSYLTFTPWSHAVLRDGFIAMLARGISERTVLHVHTEGLAIILEERGWIHRLLRGMLRGCEVIAITDEAVDAARQSGTFARVHQLQNTVQDPGLSAPNASDVLEGQNEAAIRCVFLANYDKRKGLFDFLTTIARVRDARFSVSGVIMGGATKQVSSDQLKQAVLDAGLESSVRITGFADDDLKDRVFRSNDVFLYPTRHDHAPLVIIEAMSYGVVPIALDAGGIRAMLSPALGHNVYDHSASESEVSDWLVDRVCHYAARKEELSKDQKIARQVYQRQYSPEVFTENLGKILGESSNSSSGDER